ncbi:hypothetical protein RIF29_25462 [Crotalaria pallida]|uniref:Spt5 KOW domain-containing protein n=1 Tax=Crotalaria pallida TaxID=3830 RepID=A0AAN9ELN5_CROPI
MCEKVKLTIGDFGGKDGELGPSVFEDMHSSQKKPWQARENNLNRGDQDSVFSIGQTLRIRIGPLKGYLCRVIVLCRNDVTVELDSQQKVLIDGKALFAAAGWQGKDLCTLKLKGNVTLMSLSVNYCSLSVNYDDASFKWALERMGHVDEIVNNPDYKFEFPTPDDRPGPPIISFRP